MRINRALDYLCARPRGDFTIGWVLRRGWPGFARVVLLPEQLELGRAARLVERVIFLGSMASLVYFGSLPLGALGEVHDFTDGLVLVAVVKIVAIVAGWVVQFSLRIIAYVVGGFGRLAPRRPIDLERYSGNREKEK